jgi:hypothetical protein
MSKHVLILAVVFVAAVLLAALIISGARCIGILFAALPARTERWAFVLLCVLFAIVLVLRAWESYQKNVGGKWWFRPGAHVWKKREVRERLEWSDIHCIMHGDPLTPCDRLPESEPSFFVRYVIVLLAGLFMCLIVTVGFISAPAGVVWGLPLAIFASRDQDKLLAVVAAVLALAGVLYTIRAKVRSENRQKWIDQGRGNLAVVINYAGYKNEYQAHAKRYWADPLRYDLSKGAPPLYPDANLARLTLELLFNPSEKDHRTLSTLLRLLCGFDPIQIDAEVTKHLPCLSSVNHDSLIIYTIRLSNAMLKREWELIKFGK